MRSQTGSYQFLIFHGGLKALVHHVVDIVGLTFPEVAVFVPQSEQFAHPRQRKDVVDVVDYRVDVRGLGGFLRRDVYPSDALGYPFPVGPMVQRRVDPAGPMVDPA